MGRGDARHQRGDLNNRLLEPIKPRLLGPAIDGARREAQAQRFVKGDAACGIRDTDRGMIDAKAGMVAARSPPAERSGLRQKSEQLKRVPIRIAEFEGGDTAR